MFSDYEVKKKRKKSNPKDFPNRLSAYLQMIHKVNLIHAKSEADKEDNFQEVVYQLWCSFQSLQIVQNVSSINLSAFTRLSVSSFFWERAAFKTGKAPCE